ncbi:MAG: Dihydropteroate synthase [Alphaproteobacteria bacterium MarineAlpha6_Bin4]|nr:MAG: Dihydropteroate synthase [Alphaproteobacteria bacterium MarineAlpha6_Bin3]PPR38044.1 MAG: Dihydropteroate synthase [Alphaproteobacteria bacterium MarineAlpha6_Bin4]|tara:strand:- start:27968 stop:28813 length:846 start_codon:yes stop_codon:yes gene_type:complete
MRPIRYFNKPYLGFKTPAIMGILNITPDSFSDGGKYFSKPSLAIKNAIKMNKLGADIIDIGAESTRPGAKPINPVMEIKRLKPIIIGLKKNKINISVDTRNSLTMKFALDNGVKIINDVSALNHDHQSLNYIKKSNCLIVLMHMQGTPETMQTKPRYKFAPRDIYYFLKKQILNCEKNGIKRKRIIIDPGIGFGKTSKHNIQILQNLKIFQKLKCNILIGLSRKRIISDLTKNEKPTDRIPGTIAANQFALDNGADIIRVHDVKEAVQAKLVWQALKKKNV